MWLIDGHLDLAMLAVCGRDLTHPLMPAEAGHHGCVTLPDLRAGGVHLALATIFTQCDADPATCPYAYAGHADLDGAAEAGWRQMAIYRDLEQRGHVRIVRWRDELPAVDHEPRPDEPLPLLLLLEGADPIRGVDDVARWHDAGLRAVGLAWAMGSRYAGGDSTGGGLTDAGRELVAALDERGVIHDVSHLAAAGVDDLLDCATGPVVASHSNCRAIVSEHDRHLYDHHIAAIAERGGVVGLNLYTRFLRKDRRADLADTITQLDRVAEVGGDRAVALGSDMDGGFGPEALPTGLDSPRRLPDLIAALAASGWSTEQVAGFAHRNWHRVLHDALPTRATHEPGGSAGSSR